MGTVLFNWHHHLVGRGKYTLEVPEYIVWALQVETFWGNRDEKNINSIILVVNWMYWNPGQCATRR
jgi:hypothetical protein